MKRKHLFCLSLLLYFSCSSPVKDENNQEEHTGTRLLAGDTGVNTSCPRITSDLHNNVVISWVKEVNDTQSVLVYAVSKDKGQTFEAPLEVSPSRGVHPHGENLPKLIFKPNGEVLAIWGTSNPSARKKYGGLIFYAQSFDEGKTWGSPIPLVSDTASIDQRYFDVALLPNGEAGIIWLDNRTKTTAEGSTLYWASTSGKEGFKNERPFAETICQCCRTELFIDQKGRVHAAFRDIINDSIRDMVHAVSTDNGRSFSTPKRISADNWIINGCPHTGPAMAENQSGLHFTWYTMGSGEGVFYCHSTNGGSTFSKKEAVSSNALAKHPQMASRENGHLLIVWDEQSIQGEVRHSKIGLQLRDTRGRVIRTAVVDSGSNNLSYPVMGVIDEHRIIVAYTRKAKEREQVYYRLMGI